MTEPEVKNDPFELLKGRLEAVREVVQQMDRAAAAPLIRMILRANRTFITGKGRSGLVAECFAMRLMQTGFEVHVPGEATCPRIRRNDLMVAVSCSGTTMTTVQMARVAERSGARVVAVTADADSPLARTADHVLLVPVTGEGLKQSYRDVMGPHNNTLFEEAVLLCFDSIVQAMLEHEGIPEEILRDRHTNLE